MDYTCVSPGLEKAIYPTYILYSFILPSFLSMRIASDVAPWLVDGILAKELYGSRC